MILSGIYTVFQNRNSIIILTPSLIGFLLFMVSLAVFLGSSEKYDYLIIRDKRYSLEKSEDGTERTNIGSENIEGIRPLLEEISDSLDLQEKDLIGDSEKGKIQYSINMINKLLAIKEYKRSIGEKEGLRVVDFENERIVAKSKNRLNLSEGLKFNILSTESSGSNVNGRIGTAELVESESSSGDLFEFTLLEWKNENDDWISRATIDLENGQARMRIITDDFIDIEEETLKTTLNCLQQIKHDRELKYDY